MRKTKREMNLSVQLITPEQKLEEISLLEDHKYNFVPLNNRQSKINGWLNEDNLAADGNLLSFRSLKSSIIFGKALSTPKQMANNLSNNKNGFIRKANSWNQAQRNRSHSVQLPSRTSMLDDRQISGIRQYNNHTKIPFQFLRKKSGRTLISKSKVYESNKHSIEGITYPIFQMKNSTQNPESQYNPVMGKIRLLMKNRRHNSTNF